MLPWRRYAEALATGRDALSRLSASLTEIPLLMSRNRHIRAAEPGGPRYVRGNDLREPQSFWDPSFSVTHITPSWISDDRKTSLSAHWRNGKLSASKIMRRR